MKMVKIPMWLLTSYMMKYFAICDETTCQFTKNFIFSYRIIERITEFSFIIFFRFYTFYRVFYIVYSGLSSVIFSSLPIIYCILLFVCHFFSIKPVRARVKILVYFSFWINILSCNPLGLTCDIGVCSSSRSQVWFSLM